jgi:hypothetical protein
MKLSSILVLIKKIFYLILIIGLTGLISCSDSLYCTNSEKLNIEYYSEGGFTGGSTGLTIDSTGTVFFWEKNLNTPRKITKTFKVKDKILSSICTTIKNPSVFTYKNNSKGNYTTYLTIHLNSQISSISFNKSDLPVDMPDAIKGLLSDLNNINQ